MTEQEDVDVIDAISIQVRFVLFLYIHMYLHLFHPNIVITIHTIKYARLLKNFY